jgi:hypothetical protein
MLATPDAEEPVAEACDMNLGPRQRRVRLRIGVAGLVVFAAVAAALIAADAPPLARLWTWPLAYAAAIGFLQYRAKT